METSSERNIQVEDIASSDGEPKMVDKVDEGREADIPQHQSDPNPFLVSRGRIAPSGEEEEEEEEQLSVDEAEAKTPPDEPKTADEIDQLSGESTSPQQESEILKNAAQTDPPRVLDLLSKGGNAHAISEDGKSFLKLLVENLDTTLDILKSVLERMRNDQSEAWNAAKQNALAVVLQSLNFDFARLLIEEGAGITQSREGERWPLCHAAWNERADIVSLLLKHNANVNEQDDEGLSALDNACRFGYEGIVDVLLAHKPKPKIDITDDSGMTPLVTSIYYERTSIVEKLLANGADPNGTPDSAWTPLNPACEIGNKEIIDLLLARNGIDINKEDNNGRFPLAEACSSGHREIVSLLLAHKSIEVNRKDNHGWTPLIYACRSGDTKMVELILDGESLADIDMPGNESRTPLSVASELGYFEIARKLVQHGTHGARVNTASDKGWTALHYASYYGHTDVVQLLMDNEAALDSRSHDGCTALHLAGQQGYVETVKTLLRDPRTSVKLLNAQDNKYSTALHMAVFHNGKTTKLDYEDRMVPELYHELVPKHTDVVNILLELGADASKTDAAGHTALFLAVGNWDMDMLRLLLENMATADFGKTNLEYEVLTWTAENCDAHDIFVLLARKGRYMSRKEILGDRETSALCWAACHADSTLVRILLCSIASSSKAKAEKEQKSAEEEVLKFLKSADAQDRGAKSKGNNASKRIDQRVKKEGDKLLSNRLPEIPSKREQYEPVLDLLRNPPPVRTTVSQTCQMPKPSTKFSLKNFDAAIVDFYAGNGLSGFLHRARQVEEIIYDPEHGPKSVMKAAQEKAQELYLDNGKDNVFSSDNFKFRWIHLPANNMQWMNDLMSRIYFEHGKNYDAYGESYKFFRTSCHQVPDASSKSRYMEPGCSRMKLKECEVCQMKKLKDCKNCEQLLATYNTDYERLLEAYSRTAIHGLRTLDESYYQFESKDGETERRRRNKDQVVTRKLYGDALEGEVSWDLVGIEQLWLWVIDSETIITSSTHRIDGRSNIVELSILDRLKGLGHKENEGVQPDTPQGLSKFIVETCVRFYDQTRYSSADVTPAPHPISWSIQQFFSDAVNGAAIEETGLFKKFIDSKLIMEGKRDHHQGASSSLKDEYVRRTAGLLSDVRDMRDELNMLKSIIGDQHAVQRGLGESDCTAGHLINDLNKMDTATERIYKAVNATLTLEQNVIALNQSEETIQQGRILMAFTVATIIFLPMSFLVSLLAVDITAFPHNSSGDLQYTAGWVFPIIFCVSAVIWIPLILFAFRSQAIRSTGRMQKSIKAHFFNSTENKAGANTGNNTNNNNGNNRIADISGHLGRLYHSRTEQLRWRLPSRIIPDEEAQETHKPVLVEPGKLT